MIQSEDERIVIFWQGRKSGALYGDAQMNKLSCCETVILCEEGNLEMTWGQHD